ncbi:MAG: hypothetical protein KF802_14795 [Bdellovibrionaceae bacterium]|nr:hypothetical protein [Pseudobdellovibrionaceae bacterium]
MRNREKSQSKPRNDLELKFLKRVGQKVHKDLSNLDKPVEWLAFESETSRATVRRIFDADRNVGILTLDRVARALGYKDGVIGLLNAL